MKSPLRYLPFDAAAFFNDEHVATMGAAARGVYISALCWAWTEGSLPDDPDALAPLLRLKPADVKRSWPSVRQRFTPRDDGRLIHQRLESDRADALERYRKASEAGRVGGRASAAARKDDEKKDESDEGLPEGGLRVPQAIVEGASTNQQQQSINGFNKSTTATDSPRVAADFYSPREDEEALLTALSHESVAATAKVRELVRKYPERVRPQIEWLSWRRGLKNKPAALIQAIEENWPRPPGYIAPFKFEPEPGDVDYPVANPDIEAARRFIPASQMEQEFPGDGNEFGT